MLSNSSWINDSAVAYESYLERVSKPPLESTPADDRRGEAQERLVDAGETVEARFQAPEVVEPPEGALHDPSHLSESAAMRSTAARDRGRDASAAQFVSMRL